MSRDKSHKLLLKIRVELNFHFRYLIAISGHSCCSLNLLIVLISDNIPETFWIEDFCDLVGEGHDSVHYCIHGRPLRKVHGGEAVIRKVMYIPPTLRKHGRRRWVCFAREARASCGRRCTRLRCRTPRSTGTRRERTETARWKNVSASGPHIHVRVHRFSLWKFLK